MAINGGNIQFGINYKVDDSGLKKVQAQLSNLATMKSSDEKIDSKDINQYL